MSPPMREMLTPLMRDRLRVALAGTPDVLDGLFGSLKADDTLWDRRPDPERFTLREIVAHLADYEAVWLERLAQTRDEEQPALRPVDKDQLALDHDYAHSDPAQSRAQLREGRIALVEFVSGLADEDWQRIGHLPAPNGPLTLETQAAFVIIHDGYHTAQVAQWLKGLL